MKALAFGGAFNPPTIAHIELAHYAMEAAGAECVIFLPSKQSYVLGEQGKNFSFTDEERLSMLTRIAQNRPWMKVCSYELALPRQPRTYQTLCHLKEEGYAPSLLLGSDKLTELETVWRHVDEICAEFGILCLSRSGDNVYELLCRNPYLAAHRSGITVIETPAQYQKISSSEVRHLILKLQEARIRNPLQTEPLRSEISSLICTELNGLEEWLKMRRPGY